jgi:hypothetical protein
MRYTATQITRNFPAETANLTRIASALLASGLLMFFFAVDFAGAQHRRYVITGLELGSRIAFGSPAYRAYKCRPSDQFADLTWCTKTESDRERRGPFQASYSMIHDSDGTVIYINRYQEPAYWSPTEVDDDIAQYSRSHGAGPRLIKKMPNRGALNGTLALWGDVKLEARST